MAWLKKVKKFLNESRKVMADKSDDEPPVEKLIKRFEVLRIQRLMLFAHDLQSLITSATTDIKNIQEHDKLSSMLEDSQKWRA